MPTDVSRQDGPSQGPIVAVGKQQGVAEPDQPKPTTRRTRARPDIGRHFQERLVSQTRRPKSSRAAPVSAVATGEPVPDQSEALPGTGGIGVEVESSGVARIVRGLDAESIQCARVEVGRVRAGDPQQARSMDSPALLAVRAVSPGVDVGGKVDGVRDVPKPALLRPVVSEGLPRVCAADQRGYEERLVNEPACARPGRPRRCDRRLHALSDATSSGFGCPPHGAVS